MNTVPTQVPHIDSATRAKIKAHLALMQVAEVVFDGAAGVASLDLSGLGPVLTTVLDRDGDIEVRRVRVPESALPKNARAGNREAVSAAVDAASRIEDDEKSRIVFSEAIDWFGLRPRADQAPSGFAAKFARSFAVTYPECDVPEAFLSDVFDSAMERLIGHTRGLLDAEALSALRCCDTFEKSAYAFYAAEGLRREPRTQAAKAYPLLAATMASRLATKAAIDRKKPLGEALERVFWSEAEDKSKLTKALLRRIGQADYPDNGVEMTVVVDVLSKLPADWFPKDRAEWDAFTDIADTFLRQLPDMIGESPEALTAGCQGKWVAFRAKLAKAAADTRPPRELTEAEAATWKPTLDASREGMSRACEGVLEMVDRFRRLTVLPVAASRCVDRSAYLSEETNRIAMEAAGRILCGGKSLAAVVELWNRWRPQAVNINAAVDIEEAEAPVNPLQVGFVKEVAEGGWAPLCNIVTAPNGVTIMPLTDEKELKYEGYGYGTTGGHKAKEDPDGNLGLNHCVGGYAGSCRSGHHIVSLRIYDPESDKKFTRLSTCEFHTISPTSNKLKRKQHYAVNDSVPAPTSPSETALTWFMAEVENGNIPINRDGIMTFLSEQRKVDDEVQRAAGYDRKNLDKVAAGLRAWAPYLTKKFHVEVEGEDGKKFFRPMTVEELAATKEVEPLADVIFPAYTSGYGPR